MTKQPLVSVIVPTKNNAQTLDACLASVCNQSYKNIELVVVDNFSTDDTILIAKKYTHKVYKHGPERSAQRNFGVNKAAGHYVAIIDSDMELTKNVIKGCVEKVSDKIMAVIIPEESFGVGFWAKCKKLERSFYVGLNWMEAARFYDKSLYKELGGYDDRLISGEDWDLSQRASTITGIDHADGLIMHNEGQLTLKQIIAKKLYYAAKIKNYINASTSFNVQSQANPLKRFALYFSHPIKLFKNPIVGSGMLFMKTCEFGFGAIGFMRSQKVKPNSSIFVVNHSTGKPGRLDVLLDYLSEKGVDHYLLTHPLTNYSIVPTTLSRDNKVEIKIARKPRGFINLIEDFIISVRFLSKYSFGTYLGSNNFDMMPIIFLRLILKKRDIRILYYPSDYSEARYKSRLMNFIYDTVETVAVKRSDFVVSNTKRAEDARIKRHKLDINKSLVIPNPIGIRTLPPKKQIEKNNFIYVGDVSHEHGLSNIIEVLKDSIKSLTIIGDGNDLERSSHLLEEYHIKSELLGKQSHDFVVEYLANFKGIGLAPYNLNSRWTWYCSPVKVGEYIALGIPVLMSDVPEASKEVKDKKLGVVYKELDLKKIKRDLKKLLVNDFYSRSIEYYKDNSVAKLFERLPI